MNKIYCRAYQAVFRLAANFMNWSVPVIYQGENAIKDIGRIILENDLAPIMLVTDKGIVATDIYPKIIDVLEKANISYTVFNETVVNPTITNVETALTQYQKNSCQGILAIGGGSPLDCAKGLAARIARPKKSLSKMRGELKVGKKTPVVIAVPTTSGTGSETTIAAVITDPDTHEKYAINDMVLIPKYAILDPLLTIGLPPHITSTTGVDALTHAVEAYVGHSNTKATKLLAEKACKLIFENLYTAYSDGKNISARENMQTASFYAGRAFTRAYVGYVHAIAHSLGGLYGTPHGLANAIILPHVLEYYGETVHDCLANLADVVGISHGNDTNAQKCEKFINAIKALNKSMEIPETLTCIKESDLPILIPRILHEANPLYPVPKILNEKDLYEIFKKLMA